MINGYCPLDIFMYFAQFCQIVNIILLNKSKSGGYKACQQGARPRWFWFSGKGAKCRVLAGQHAQNKKNLANFSGKVA